MFRICSIRFNSVMFHLGHASWELWETSLLKRFAREQGWVHAQCGARAGYRPTKVSANSYFEQISFNCIQSSSRPQPSFLKLLVHRSTFIDSSFLANFGIPRKYFVLFADQFYWPMWWIVSWHVPVCVSATFIAEDSCGLPTTNHSKFGIDKAHRSED